MSFRSGFYSVAWLVAGTLSQAGEPVEFRVHELNPDSEFSAAAVFDVDHDGDLDIVSGGFWYAAPTWERRAVREVENIRGRFDDYSNLPLDVNGDGWMDLVSCNYRSRSIYWVEHPGAGLGEWTKHVIDTPGSSETGLLADVDGDGDPDVLPNGTEFAAWYELNRSGDEIEWTRHDLPAELAGHGVGFGDVNRDGRGDVVGRAGWAEAPEDRRTGEWTWHADFELNRDCSIPILVQDVDHDGDNDLVWGRGHDFGIFWMEQVDANHGERDWSRHVIDDTWSCAHAILWADIDGDGNDDLIAGKRYLGHDGRDPGETDPLQINWYAFDGGSREWMRHPILFGGTVGMDLDPKAVDLDGDGDVDLICPARCGLHWIENLRIP